MTELERKLSHFNLLFTRGSTGGWRTVVTWLRDSMQALAEVVGAVYAENVTEVEDLKDEINELKRRVTNLERKVNG